MATSEDGYYTRFAEARIAANTGTSAANSARALDNLNHLADQYAETRVAWTGPVLNVAELSPDVDVIYPIWYSTPFDLRLREDGTSYPMRCRLRVSSGHASASSTFYVVVAESTQLIEDRTSDTNSARITVAQVATTWEDTDALLYLDARSALTATKAVITTDVLPAASAPAFWCRATCAVYASGEASSVATLSGVYLAEYLPPP